MSNNTLSKDTIQRLAFIKYLLNVAIGQSRQPEPLAAASILTFHDSIELFLQLACEHRSASTKSNIGFCEYWDVLKPKMSPDELTQKESMKRFNKSRVGLKHQGILPTKQDIEAYRVNAINFFDDNTPLVFGVGLDSISMIGLIKYEAVKTRLKQAEVFKKKNELEKAIVEMAIAFKQLVDCYETPKRSPLGWSPFSFKEDMTINTSGYVESHIHDLVNYVEDSLATMQDAIKILSFGLDYRKYARFQLLVPYVSQTMDGKYHSTKKRSETPSIEEYDFCYNFIIESALHLQDFDFAAKG